MAKVKIVKGSDRDIIITLTEKINDCESNPFDISAATEIKVQFIQEDDTTLEETLTGGGVVLINGAGGKLQVSLSAADTALLKTGVDQDVEVEITIATKITISQLLKVMDVLDQVA